MFATLEETNTISGEAVKKLFLFIFSFLFSINFLHAREPIFFKNIELHGDVSTKWVSSWGEASEHNFKAEASVGCDYIQPNIWTCVKMKGNTSNGRLSFIYLEKAYLGYRFYQSDKIDLKMELGRNKMDNMFDSKMQFDSYFTGAHIIYSFKESDYIDFLLHGGPYVIDSEENHYGWIVEAVWKRIADTPVTVKYSFTDWNAPRIGHIFVPEYYFAISQITTSFQRGETLIYASYLYNHQETKYNDGFYLGFTTGKINRSGDFLFDVNFQSIKSRLLSPHDNKALKKGIQVKFIYALDESLNLEAKFSRHDNQNNNKLEFQVIYTW